MRLTHWGPFLAVIACLALPCSVSGQTGGYTVTATLDPTPPLDRWPDWEPKPFMQTLSGVDRGHDGYFYAMHRDVNGTYGSEFVAITQVAPTTGVARVLHVIEDWGVNISDLFPGQDGRLSLCNARRHVRALAVFWQFGVSIRLCDVRRHCPQRDAGPTLGLLGWDRSIRRASKRHI